MERKTLNDLLDAIEPLIQGEINLLYGPDESGDNTIIFDSWEDIGKVEAYLNGFPDYENYKGKPFGLDENLEDVIEATKKKLEANPDSYYLQRELEKLNSHKEYMQYLEITGKEPVSLDDYDVEVGFSDEYDYCYNCSTIIRFSPDSYCWTPPLQLSDGPYICTSCADSGDYDDEVLDEYKNQQLSIPDSVNLNRLGLVKINDDSYENGLHYGMDDSPVPVIDKLNSQDIDVWFKVHPSQFYCEFDVYVKEEDADKAKQILAGVDTYQGFSNAHNLNMCLSQVALSPVTEQGIQYTKCDVSTGTVTTKTVSPEEFIDGIKDE